MDSSEPFSAPPVVPHLPTAAVTPLRPPPPPPPPRATPQPTAETAPPRPTARPTRTPWGTAAAHLLTIAGFVVMVTFQAIQIVVIDDQHNTTTSDLQRDRLSLLAGASAAIWAVGWLWWTIAAAHNARIVNSLAVSPWTVPVQLVLSIAAVPVIEKVGGMPLYTDVTGVLVYLVVVAVINLWVLSLFRHTARTMNADSGEWARLMWLPPVTAGVAMAAAMAGGVRDPMLGRGLASAVMSIGMLAYALNLHRAMSNWDRSVAARVQARA